MSFIPLNRITPQLRYLTIGWTVFWLLACILLIVLWGRSYSVADICGLTFNFEKRTNFASEKGRIFLIILDCQTYIWAIGKPREWDIRSEPLSHLYPTARTEQELLQQMNVPKFPGFYFKSLGGFYKIVVPHWFVIVVATSVAAFPWCLWQFSLRSLLIFTTLVAVGLGVIVWAIRS